jgi:hypothetical protein
MSRLTILGSFLLTAAAAGCAENPSATNLNPEGPPMVRQVFMQERITDAGGVSRVTQAIAFGDHPDFDDADDREVVNGTVDGNQRIRVVVDELLVGNYLEQIQCRDNSYQSVPIGATPDHIAACAQANDVLPETCVGPYAVCLDPVTGEPIGVMDVEDADSEQDGAADDTRFMDLDPSQLGVKTPVEIICTPTAGGDPINVPLNLANTFWQPSGNQQVPAAGGFSAVGPAVILAPLAGMPTSSSCTVEFHESVVDKEGEQVCAPEGGDIERPCPGEGDTGFIEWTNEPLLLVGTNPPDGAQNVPLTAFGETFARILVQFNTTIEEQIQTGAFTLLENGTPRTDIMPMRDTMAFNVNIIVPGGYVAGASYELQISTMVTDQFGVGLPESETASVTWTVVP